MSPAAKKYFSRIGHIVRMPAATDTATLYLSTLISSGVGFVSSVIVARSLGPTDFAIIAGYNAIVLTLAGFTDFGLGTGLIKYTAPHLKDGGKHEDSNPYFRFVFLTEIVIGSLLLSLGLLFASFIPKIVGQSISLSVVRIAVISAAVTSTAAYIGAAMAAHKKFKLNAAISISMSLLKLAFVIILWKLSNISIHNILLGYVALSFLTAAIGFIAVPKDYLSKTDRASLRKAGNQIIKFSGWLTLSFFITSIMGKLDFFYLYRLQGATQAGVYAAAQQLSMVYSILVGAISTVMTPYISEKVSYADRMSFLKRMLPLACGLALLFAISTLIAPVVIKLVFGSKYIGAIAPLKVLVVSLAINVILIPISLMYVPLGKVRYGTLVTAIELVIAILLYPRMIKAYGANGAATTILLTAVIGLVLYSVILIILMRKDRPYVRA